MPQMSPDPSWMDEAAAQLAGDNVYSTRAIPVGDIVEFPNRFKTIVPEAIMPQNGLGQMYPFKPSAPNVVPISPDASFLQNWIRRQRLIESMGGLRG